MLGLGESVYVVVEGGGAKKAAPFENFTHPFIEFLQTGCNSYFNRGVKFSLSITCSQFSTHLTISI